MLQLNDISLQFAGDLLYKHVDLLFPAGITATASSEPTARANPLCLRIHLRRAAAHHRHGDHPRRKTACRVLEQNHFKYDEYSVMDTVIMGNRRLYDIMQGKRRALRESRTSLTRTVSGPRSWRANLPR